MTSVIQPILFTEPIKRQSKKLCDVILKLKLKHFDIKTKKYLLALI